MKNYFGIIKGDEFDSLSQKAQNEFLISKNLFQDEVSVPLVAFGSKLVLQHGSKTFKLSPKEEVLNALYEYLLKRFSTKIELKSIEFFAKFNDEIFGMERALGYNVGLKRFKEKFKEINHLDIDFAYKKMSSRGVLQIENINKFKFLKYCQQGMKTQLGTFKNVIEFLKGNQDCFDPEKFESEKHFNSFVEFEFLLQVLIGLNDSYQFTDDFYFSESGKLIEKYQQYKSIFISKELFVFVYNKIKNFKDLKISLIESLYAALQQLDLIGGNKIDFINYINEEYEITTSKIRKYNTQENRKHDFRVVRYKEELKEFVPKKDL